MCVQYIKIKSALTLAIILAMLIIPFYTFEPANCADSNFYGGTFNTDRNGQINSLTVSIAETNPTIDGIYSLELKLTDGTVIAFFPIYIPAGSTDYDYHDYTSYPTSGYNNTLIAGQSYVFTFSVSYGGAVYSSPYVTYTPLWKVTFSTSGLDATVIASNTVVTINSTTPVSYSALNSYSTYVLDGSSIGFSFASVLTTSDATRQFVLSSANASSPISISYATNIQATYIAASNPVYHNVTLKGPYYEDGTVATNQTVSFTLSYVNQAIYHGTITSTSVAGEQNFTSISAYNQLTWNASSASATFNATRVYTFINDVSGVDESTVYIYILDATKPAYQYTFSVTDFYGMVNPYLQSSVSPNGNASIPVERFNLKDGGGFVTFVMQQYQQYSLSFICSQGTYTQSFTPNILGTPGQNVVSLSVSAGNFPVSNTTGVVSYFANRTDSATIFVSYFDPNGTTTWVNAAISHVQGSQTIVDYASANSTGSSQSWSWSQADANTDYQVTITADVAGTVRTYLLSVPSINGDNPWAGIDWGNLGRYIPTLPATYTGWGGIDPTQMIAAFLIIAALGIGSYFSTGASCLICWVIGGILMTMGWWQGSVPLLAFALVITILILIDEYKKGNFAL